MHLYQQALLIISIVFSIVFPNTIEDAKDAINHASTYHWLARYKLNDSSDLLKSKEYLNKAISILESLDDSLEKENLLIKAKSNLDDIEIRYDNCYDNINNVYNFYNILYGYQKTYEFYDDPEVTAITNATQENVLTIPKPSNSDFQYDVIVISDPPNYALEDEVRVELNLSSHFYPRPIEDILDVISMDEFKNIYSNNFSNSILTKLSDAWNKNDLFIAKVVQNDKIDDVYYYGLYIYEWNKERDAILRSVYSDGLIEDRRDFGKNNTIMILAAVLFTFIFSLYSHYIFKLFKEKRDVRDVYSWSGLLSFILSLISMNIILFAIRPIAPDPSAMLMTPYSLSWILLFHIFISVAPIVIVYLSCVMIPKISERICDGETITSLLGGYFIALFYFIVSRAQLESPSSEFYPFLFFILTTCFIYCVWTSHHTSLYFIKVKAISLIPLASLIIISLLYSYSHMVNDINIVYISYATLLIIPTAFEIITRHIENKRIAENDGIDDASKELTEKILLEKINNPDFIDPSTLAPDYVTTKTNEFIEKNSSNSKPGVMYIHGSGGTGKTRMANRIAQSIIELNGEEEGKWILFGDCDELNKEGSGVPFEPFSQALHGVLEAGRFEPPAKRANKIKEGLKSTGLETVLDTSGLGILNTILGAQDENVQPSTTSEMIQIIIKTILGLSEKHPVVFIIDDMHWIDPISDSLFQGLIKKIQGKINNNIYFIFTYNDDGKADAAPGGPPLEFLENEKNEITLMKIDSKKFNYVNRFDDILIYSLDFENHSAQRYLQYINNFEVDNILRFLQPLKIIIENDGIEIINQKVRIKNSFHFGTLPPPTNIVDMIEAQLSTLTESQKQVMKFASFIGQEFKASILSEALKMGRLQVLYDLEVLESKGIIADVRAQDDVYEFKSNAIINVIRYIANITEDDNLEIPQIVREYHYRVATSLKKQIQNESGSMRNDDLFTLAKRSWAAGDRMLSEAFEYNYNALFISYRQLRYEEAINFGSNICDISNKLESKSNAEKLLKSYLVTAQAKIILDQDAEEIDKLIEDSKLLIKKSTLENSNIWSLVILNVEADACMHDHSGKFQEQIPENQKQLGLALQKVKNKNSFEVLFARLSQIRLSNDSTDTKSAELTEILNIVNAIDINDQDVSLTPLSAFSDISTTNYNYLKSEILEDLIKIMSTFKSDSKGLDKLFKTCSDIKSEINDIEGLATISYHYGKKLIELKMNEEATTNFKSTLSNAERIGSELWEVRAKICIAKIKYLKKDINDARQDMEQLNDKKINWDDLRIKYDIIILLLKIAIIEKDERGIDNYIKQAQHIFDLDPKHGYLYKELKDLINSAHKDEK